MKYYPMSDSLMIGYTTVETKKEATRLAKLLIQKRLAACVQIEGPITSHYEWKGTIEQCKEYNLTIKFLGSKSLLIEEAILKEHSYEAPQWVVTRAEYTSESYLAWAQDIK